MSKIDPSKYAQDTLAVRAGQARTNEAENCEPIFLSSSFTYQNAAEAAARFSGELPGNIYSRFTNPTVRTFEERLAAMEGAERCVATASGMSAILATAMALLKGGDHVVCSRSVFGTTLSLFGNLLAKFNLATTFVPLTDYDAWADAITPATKLLFLETPSNPLTEIADIRRLADLAHENGCLLLVAFVPRYCSGHSTWGRIWSFIPPPNTWMVRAVALAAPCSAARNCWGKRSSASSGPRVPP